MRRHIQLCLPEHDRSAQQRLYRETTRQTVYVFTELAAVWCWPADKILSRVTTVDICEEFHQASGCKIILAPHLGSWETLGIWLGQNCDAIILYKRPRNKALDGFVRQMRGRTGGTPVPTKKQGLRKLLVGLRAGKNLMILPDQKPGGRQGLYRIKNFWYQRPNHNTGKESMRQGRLRGISCYYLPQFTAGRVWPDNSATRSRTPGQG